MALTSSACAPRNPDSNRAIELLSPVTLGSGVLFVDRGHSVAYAVDLQATPSVPRTIAVGTDPTVLVGRPGHDEAIVLSRGARGDLRQRPEPARLTVVPGSATASTREYTLGSPFNALAVTADGRRALAHYAPSASLGRLLFNPNEIAIVDLDRPSGDRNPVLRTVRSFGGVPNAVVYSPPFGLRGEMRTVAVVLSDAYVTLIDLEHLDRPEITVRLTLPNDPRAIRPTQVVFDAPNLTIYVRADASDDVYVLRLNEMSPDAAGNDFRPTVNQLAAGRSPADMVIFGPDDARRLLVVSAGSREARIVDARSNTVRVIDLDASASRIVLFEGASPRDPARQLRAFLYAADGSTAAATFLDLAQIDERGSQNVDTLQLNRPIRRAISLPERDAVMLEHPGATTAGSLSLLDLIRRTASPIFAEVALDRAVFDSDRQSLWVAPPVGTRLGYIDLRSYHPGEVRLDAPVTTVLPLAADAAGRRRIVAVHDAAEGYVTVLDATDPQRETSYSVRGFALTGLLDREVSP